jgi:exportin-2 (importin alpha re-exporter)
MKEFIKMLSITLQSLNLYCQNYYDDIKKYHDSFIEIVWNLTKILKQDEMYSRLAIRVMDYYNNLFQYHRAMLNSEQVKFLVDFIIVPNMNLTSKEYDDFEDNPINFLKIELEEADNESCNLISKFSEISCN